MTDDERTEGDKKKERKKWSQETISFVDVDFGETRPHHWYDIWYDQLEFWKMKLGKKYLDLNNFQWFSIIELDLLLTIIFANRTTHLHNLQQMKPPQSYNDKNGSYVCSSQYFLLSVEIEVSQSQSQFDSNHETLKECFFVYYCYSLYLPGITDGLAQYVNVLYQFCQQYHAHHTYM